MKSLSRTLSGCGSCDFPQSSPVSTRSRRGSSGSCFTPSDRGHDHAEGTDPHPYPVRLNADGSANSTPVNGARGETVGGVTGNGNNVDETAISVTVNGGVAVASTGPGRDEGIVLPGERPPYGDFAPPKSGGGSGGGTPNGSTLERADLNPEEIEWGKSTGFSGSGSPTRGGGGGGSGGSAGGVFWPGPGGSPGLLRVAVDGEEDNGRCSGRSVVRNSKSSLGSGSLASVICESPSGVSFWNVLGRHGGEGAGGFVGVCWAVWKYVV